MAHVRTITERLLRRAFHKLLKQAEKLHYV